TLAANTAQGGAGGGVAFGGDGFGGGLYAAAGTVELHGTSVTGNSALGGAGGHSKGLRSAGVGGGLYFDPAAAVCRDAFPQATVKKHHAPLDPNIHGPWPPC